MHRDGMILVVFLSPEGDLLVPAIAGIGLLVIACFVYRRLSRVRDGR